MNFLLLAVTIQLTWDPTSASIDTGYRVKWGFEQGGPYPHVVEAGQLTSVTVDEPWPLAEIVYFTAYAYNAYGESGPSNEVSYVVPTPDVVPIPTPLPTPPATPTPLPTPPPTPLPTPIATPPPTAPDWWPSWWPWPPW